MNYETGTTNVIYTADRAWEITGSTSNAAEITFTVTYPKSEESQEADGELHCACERCMAREDIINKIWQEYCIIKDMAKWFTSQRIKATFEQEDPERHGGFRMEVPFGANPLLACMLVYRDIALKGKNPYEAPVPEYPEQDDTVQ